MKKHNMFGFRAIAAALIGLSGFLFSMGEADSRVLEIRNRHLVGRILLEDGRLVSDRLDTVQSATADQPHLAVAVETDADFEMELVWTGWQAPGMLNNAENPVRFSKKDFRFRGMSRRWLPDGTEALDLFFQGIGHPLELRISYELPRGAFYIRRRLAVRDPESGRHFLHWVWSRLGEIPGTYQVLNRGGFGQPLAFRNHVCGFFLGLEYPASENLIVGQSAQAVRIGCGQEAGEIIGSEWFQADPVVLAVTPPDRVKIEFMRYLNDIRIAALKPYILYNTWYDLRAPEMVQSPDQVLNQENVMRIIGCFESNLVRPYGVKLDAFVLDDGWDVYQSDWVIRAEQFPRGLKPVADRLKTTGTDLGIWFGPTGGYSNRNLRIEWMKDHGYEIVGDQLCLAGTRYRTLLNARVSDFIRSQGVGYFKWDGIQFACSEPGHGHATGIYSRRAVMESLKGLCRTARHLNPDIFLNVTSGTWLSPWWLKFANTIWMQGYDYGYANVPSISQRDRAMTYRDYVLYDGLRRNNCWFPLANLMTHGIIKGHLQKLGGEAEPLDKFTDNALLYVARGVSMWELYISPDLLTKPEWEAVARALIWAKDRFPVLMSTQMIGGDPGEKEAYGYLHASGNRGVLAVRNPYIEPALVEVTIDESAGFVNDGSRMVLERIYPTRWFSPDLIGCGEKIRISLQGYETALYEIFPLSEASVPVLADAVFQDIDAGHGRRIMGILETGDRLRLLNPEKVAEMSCGGKPVDPQKLDFLPELSPPVLRDEIVERLETGTGCELKVLLEVDPTVRYGRLGILMENDRGNHSGDLPDVRAVMDGHDAPVAVQMQEKSWKWALIDIPAGRHALTVDLSAGSIPASLPGKLSVWFLADQQVPERRLEFAMAAPVSSRPAPPLPRPAGVLNRVVKLKAFNFR